MIAIRREINLTAKYLFSSLSTHGGNG